MHRTCTSGDYMNKSALMKSIVKKGLVILLMTWGFIIMRIDVIARGSCGIHSFCSGQYKA